MAEIVESVWEYPRPPRLERTGLRLRVVHGGVVVAQTERGWRVLETSHPPVYYFPPGDVRLDLLEPSARGTSFCEFKGVARYWTLRLPQEADVPARAPVPAVGWSYDRPTAGFAALAGAIAFYASKVDECWVGAAGEADERVQPQEGDFYGGWITSWVRGPFKGAPGTRGW